jgi:nucleotide-binding universal stress UspA family protein
MYRKIVVAVDGSALSTTALQHALELSKAVGAEITAVTVTEPSMVMSPAIDMVAVDVTALTEQMEAAKAETAKAVLQDAKALAGASTIEAIHLAGRYPAEGILEAANSAKADLVVMGSHGRRGLGRLLLGSQAAEVLSRSTIPVLIVKQV